MNFKFKLAASVAALACLPLLASAQEVERVASDAEQADESEKTLDRVVITGSYIAGDAQEQSVPVDVFAREELEVVGAPQLVSILENTPALAGLRNQMRAGLSNRAGVKVVNIRGLGEERTLALLNGKRIVSADTAVDVGNFPMIALERVELLKNGGAVTYGTDAIAGVFNFITRNEFEGLEVQAGHNAIDGSDGDLSLGVIWGARNDGFNLVMAAEYEERNMLSIPELDLVPRGDPATGGWPVAFSSVGNPGTFFPSATRAGVGASTPNRINDPNCGMTGPTGAPSWTSGGNCAYSFLNFQNIINPQERFKVFASFNAEANDTTEVYGEVLWANLNAINDQAPSFPPTAQGLANVNFVPIDSPSMQGLLAGLTPTQAQPFINAGGAMWRGRARAIEGPAASFPRERDTLRLVAGVRGQVPFADAIDYDLSASYSQTEFNNGSFDVLTDRFSLALWGLGGPGCNAPDPRNPSAPANAAFRGNAAAGCGYFNVLGGAIGAAPGSALYNDPAIYDWFIGDASSVDVQDLFVSDAVFTGEVPVALRGGNIAWAAGGQYREFKRELTYTGDNRAGGPGGLTPLHFLGLNSNDGFTVKTKSLFGELRLPVTDRLDIDLGVRREDYDIDAVTKPKASLRFEPTDWLTLRASYEEVFRQPLLPSVERRGVVFFAPVGETITVIRPVPTDLDPEQSTNIGFGAIFKPTDSLTVNIDYYSMAFSGPFAEENPNSASARKFLADGTVFDPAVHLASNVAAVEVEALNGPDIDVSGLDFEATYDLESNLGDWAFGLNGTYILEYLVDGAVGPLAGQSYDAAGTYNQFSQVLPIETVPLPKLKLNAFAGLDLGRQSARIYARYVDKYDIEYSSRQGLFPDITQVDSMLTFDAHYNVSLLNERVDLSLGVINIADENPPLTHDDWAYDSFTHNPLGRYFRIGLTYRH